MIKLLFVFAVSLILAYCSQNEILVFKLESGKKIDLPLIAMILLLSFFCGLRTSYNDTEAYIVSYKNAPGLSKFFSNGIELTNYPAFYGMQSLFRHHISPNANVFLVSIALFSVGSIVSFIKRHSGNFVFSMILFFSFGLYISHFASMKQCLAIAVLTYAIEALIKKKMWLFYILVFVAMLFHSFAILFIIVPIFTNKPWTFTTYVSVAVIVFVLLTFESTIAGLLSYADVVGKENYTADLVLNSESINPFRLAIFAIPPLMSFLLQEFVASDAYDRKNCIFMNLCILTCLIMCLGIGSSANLFARSAFYFEIGTIIAFPWFLHQVFDKSTERFVTLAASACYILFFYISNTDFSSQYRAISILDFARNIF